MRCVSSTGTANQNGHLEQSDVEESARRIGSAFGRAANSPEQHALIASCQQFWQALAQHADVDRDGRLSQDEYVAAFSSGLMSDLDAFDRIYRTLLENVVRVADTSGDGKLNEEEYLRLMQTWYNATESDATEMFRRLDVDGDGLLTLDEMVRAATHFYLGDDPVLPPPVART